MSARMKAYQFLVNRVPEIQKEYWRRRKLHKRPAQRAADWCALLGMNLAWTFGFRSWAADDLNPDAKRILPKEAESALHEKLPPEEFAKKLLAHDVISFDVFDTLVLRPFERPTDLFHIVGARLEYLDFARLRVEAETKARQRKFKKEETYEVTLEEIWDVVEEDAGIPKSVGMPVEIETELAYCFGNPYMLEVFRYLEGARIICTSDMYLSSVLISEMLEKCGFRGISRIYVSNEQGASKSDGSLYRKVKKELERECDSARKGGSPLAFAHTGDNRVSDVEKAKEAGWAANHYPNVNDLGEWYRARDLSAVTGSLYRGIVNARLHNGLHTYSKEYELGYVYGGLFVTGYCQWIHRYAREHGIDQILFLARDGDILYRAYRRMYAEEMDGPDLQYVYWSRLAATKLGAGYFKYDFFRRFLHHKVNQGYTLQEIFAGMELEELLAGCLEKTGFSETTRLISANEDKVEKYLKQNWQQVLDIYQGQREAAGIYYRKSLGRKRGCGALLSGKGGMASPL